MMVGLMLIFLAVSAARGLQIVTSDAAASSSRDQIPIKKQITVTTTHNGNTDDRIWSERPVVAQDGLVFVGSSDGKVYVLDMRPGGDPSKPKVIEATGGQHIPISSIAFDGRVLVVGANWADNYAGGVFLLTGPGSAMRNLVVPVDDRKFGQRVAVDNGVIVVLAQEEVYVFETSGALQTKLRPESRWNLFDASIAIENDVIVVGTPKDADWVDRVHIFNTAGFQVGKLTAPDHGFFFGYSVAIDNGLVAIGAPQWDKDKDGKAYVFDTRVHKMTELSTTDVVGEYFGSQVTVEAGLVLVVATPGVYVFDAATGDQLDKLWSQSTGRCSRVALDYANRKIVEFGAVSSTLNWKCYPNLVVGDFSDFWIN